MDVQLDGLLTIEGILGAVVVDRQGRVLAHAALSRGDAQLVSSVAPTIFVDFAAMGDATGAAAAEGATPRSYATFELQQGQIHLGAGRELALILLTEPDLDHELVRDLLAALVVDLEQSLAEGRPERRAGG